MKLTHLMEQHRKFSDRGLAGGFGDGYLVAHNRIYRQVREAALKAGYHFSSERDDAFEAFPLLQLENMLRSKRLPYLKNAAAFEKLTSAQLGALDTDDIDGNLKKNFVFHEACHAVVREISQQVLGPVPGIQDLQAQRAFALRMLLEESCANTGEFLGIVDLHDQIHRVFFELNSYMGNFTNRTHLKNALAEIGEPIVIRFMILAYAQANFLRPRIEDRDFNAMICLATASGESAELDAKKLKTLRALGKVAFELSERFRVQTTSFHLRLAGIKTPAQDLFKFDFLASLQTKEYAEFLKRCAVVFGSEGASIQAGHA